MGTLLAARGVATAPPLWSGTAVRDAPRAVRAVHRDYAAAGATHHTAATFRTQPRYAGREAWPLTRDAVALARDAVPAGHAVMGSMAPLADCYRPDLSPGDPGPEHAAMAALLARAGVDILLVETFAHPGEATIATRAAVATGTPVWCALTPGFRADLLTPAALAEAASAVWAAGATRVLVNCVPAAGAMPYVDALATVAAGRPWGVKANAGAPGDPLSHGVPRAAEGYAVHAARWVARGASAVGGCCGTGPDHVRAVSILSSHQSQIDDRLPDG